jgi:hypothetical protein
MSRFESIFCLGMSVREDSSVRSDVSGGFRDFIGLFSRNSATLTHSVLDGKI